MPRRYRAKPPYPFRCFSSSPEVTRLIVLMYVRFPLSLRNVEDLLFAGDIRRQRASRMRGSRHWRWHLNEMYVKLSGEVVYLWRAVHREGEVLESDVTRSCDKAAALCLVKALKRHGSPEAITADGLRSYCAAMTDLGNAEKQEVGRWANNRVENSHLLFQQRERAILRSRQMKSLQKFASVHASVHNLQPGAPLHRPADPAGRRSAPLAEWQVLAS